MAKINALPSLEVINTLKGTLDFYYWKGIPCVRKWPVIPPSSRTQPSLNSAHLFGLIVKGWGLVGATAKALYHQAAADQPRTGRDLYVSGVLGGQHDASMSDFLDLLTEIKDYLAALQALLGPLGSVDTDDLQIDIKSALATLPVKGEDQLFSLGGVLAKQRQDTISGAGGYVDSDPVTAGKFWVVTSALVRDNTNPITGIVLYNRHNAVSDAFYEQRRAAAANEYFPWGGLVYLDTGDVLRAYFQGALAGDVCRVHLHGYIMTIET